MSRCSPCSYALEQHCAESAVNVSIVDGGTDKSSLSGLSELAEATSVVSV